MTSEEPDAFVGRSHELAAAEAALHRLAGGVGGLMVGVGEAGIGKSAWGRQIGLRAAAQGVLVLAGRAPASGAQTPYGAVTSALAPHLRRLPAADLGCLLSDLPSLGAVFEGVGLPVPSLDDAGLLRTRLAVAVLCLLGRLAADRPVLVWIDDVHWIDPASAALMEQVVAELPGMPVLLLVTARPDGDSLPRPIRTLVGALPTGERAEVVALGPLSEGEVAKLATALVEGDLPPRLVNTVWAKSGGVALFARELLLDNSNARHRRGARDALSLDHEGFGGLPDSISDLLAERLEGLDAPALDVARVLACAGGELDQTVLEEVIGCQEGLWESVEVLAAAGVAGVSGCRGGTADSVALSHPLIGEVVLGRLAPSARQHLHERLGSALRQAGRPSSVLALHYARADPAVGGDGVIDILATGARELLARGAFVEAAGCLEAALGRVLSGSSVARRAGLLEDLGTAWFGLAEPAAAATFWLEALGSMPEDGAAVSLRMRVADAMFLSGRPAESVAQARLAVDVVEGNHAPPMRARFGLLRAALRAADVDAARTAAAPMAGRLGGTDDPAEVMMSGAARASLAMLDNRPRHAYRVAIGALDAAGACEGDRGLVRVARDLEDLALWSAMWLGDLPVIRRHAESSLSLSAGQGHPGFRWRGLAGRFVADFLAGAWDDASDALVELDALTAEGIPGLSRFVPLCHAALELPRGDPDICRQLVGQLEWAMAREAEPDPEAAVSVGAVVALLHLHDGEPAAAWARCAPWAGTRCPSGLPPWADLAAAEAALAAGRHDDARRLADSLEADLPGRSYVGVLARSLRARARSGGPDQTELLGAAEEFAIMGMPYEAARARRLSGKKSQAGAALATFERLGATAEAQRVRDAIDAAGAGSECAGRRTLSIRREGWVPTSLTRRETEVASMVAQGLSNAAVAEALFVSLRTVTSHLEHIYTKLGIRSRAALTMLVVEHHLSAAR